MHAEEMELEAATRRARTALSLCGVSMNEQTLINSVVIEIQAAHRAGYRKGMKAATVDAVVEGFRRQVARWLEGAD
jgi:hypothetical protein